MTDRQLTAALAGSATVATTAPALRRSQAWRWVLHTARLDLYADPTAQLSREETLITCGSAVHRARVALAADGVDVRIELLPDDDADHVATLTPVGSIGVTEDARRLVEAAQRTRPASGEDPAPPWTVGRPAEALTGVALAEAAQAEHTGLRALGRAEARRLADTVPLLARPPRVDADRDERTMFAVLYGEGEAPAAWLRAGQALSAVELTATLAGLSLAASASAVALARSRAVLRELLPEGNVPYLGLRITPRITPAAGRRRLADRVA